MNNNNRLPNNTVQFKLCDVRPRMLDTTQNRAIRALASYTTTCIL